MDLAVLGDRLVTAIADGARVRVDIEGDPVPKVTPSLPSGLMPPAIAVSPSGDIAIAARTDTAQVYGCILGRPWVYLGPSNTRQGVAWKDGRFVFARVVWSMGRLYEQEIVYHSDENIGWEVDLRSEPCDSSGGIHYFDTIDGRWLPVAPRQTTVGPLTMLRPVRRQLADWRLVYCGQVVGTPDYQAIATPDGQIAFRAAAQVDYPAFVVIGDRLVCVDRGGSVRSYRPPYPVETPSPVVPQIGRPLWLAYFEFVPTTTLPANASLRQVSTWEWSLKQGKWPIATYVSGEPDGSLAALERSIEAVKGRGIPTIAYWPRSLQAGRLPRGADIVGVEAYRLKEEPLSAFEARVVTAVRRCGRVALIAQCYTSNGTLDKDLAALVPVYARIARTYQHVEAVLVFSGSGRPTGFQDHPAVQPLWRQLFAGIPSAPSIPKETVAQKPKLDVGPHHMISKEGPLIAFEDRGTTYELFTKENGSLHIRAENAAGVDQTSQRRQVI